MHALGWISIPVALVAIVLVARFVLGWALSD